MQRDKYFTDRISGFWVLAILFIFNSCQPDKGKNIPDVSHITNTAEWVHFDQFLCRIQEVDIPQDFAEIQSQNPTFWALFFEQILPIIQDTMSPEIQMNVIHKFVQDDRVKWLCDTTYQILGDLDAIQEDLDDAFRYVQFYFPEKDLPRMYSLITEFGYLPFIFSDHDGRDAIGISLEMFLGSDFPYQRYVGLSPAFSQYMTRTYNKEHLVMRTLEVLVDDYLGRPGGDRLLDLMIHNGKKKYILSQLIPMVSDSIIMAYSQQDLQWCIGNERNIWAHFLHNDLLYSQDRMSINKHVQPGPNAPGMPLEAPGNTGTWVGWKIIDNFMQRYPETTFSGLIHLKDAQSILEKSRYKPDI